MSLYSKMLFIKFVSFSSSDVTVKGSPEKYPVRIPTANDGKLQMILLLGLEGSSM